MPPTPSAPALPSRSRSASSDSSCKAATDYTGRGVAISWVFSSGGLAADYYTPGLALGLRRNAFHRARHLGAPGLPLRHRQLPVARGQVGLVVVELLEPGLQRQERRFA